MPKMKYTLEMIKYLKQIVPGRFNDEITKMFNEKFQLNLSESQMKSLRSNRKIRSGVDYSTRAKKANISKRLFTLEQMKFIEQHVVGMHNKDLANLINTTFSMNISVEQLKGWKNNHGLSSGLKGTEGKAPPNKGKKGRTIGRMAETQFKKGDCPRNYRPVGTERIDRDGYILIKVQDDGTWNERWRFKHRVLWEEIYGPVPNGHCLIFKDRNKQNVTLENLQIITLAQNARLNSEKLRFNDPELIETSLLLADISLKKAAVKKKKQVLCSSDKEQAIT